MKSDTRDHQRTLENNKLEFYNKLKRCDNVDDFKTDIIRIINQLGFSDFTFASLKRDWNYELKRGLLSTWPEEYWRVFTTEQLYTHDMLASFFRENSHPSHTSYIYNYYANAPFDDEVTKKNRMIRQLQHSFGFYETYAIPMQSSGKTYVFILSKQNMDSAMFQSLTNVKVTVLSSLGQAIHAVCSSRFAELFEPPATITKTADIAPKPLRVLTALANSDLNIAGVAKKLCISPITAHQHIAAARKALDKQTTIGAIKEAIRQGLIRYDYEQ